MAISDQAFANFLVYEIGLVGLSVVACTGAVVVGLRAKRRAATFAAAARQREKREAQLATQELAPLSQYALDFTDKSGTRTRSVSVVTSTVTKR